jgi:hypothetical protein
VSCAVAIATSEFAIKAKANHTKVFLISIFISNSFSEANARHEARTFAHRLRNAKYSRYKLVIIR